MPALTLNEMMTLTYPEGFRELSESERKQMRTAGQGADAVLSDSERHLTVSLGSKKIPAFSGLILSDKDLINKMEKDISRPMQAYGYRPGGTAERSVGGKSARYFRYSYTAESIPMSAECCLVKDGRMLWFFHFYWRTELEKDSLPVWEQILSSVRWEG